MPLERQEVVIHGVRWSLVRQGSGPALVLLHGIGASLRTWDRVIPAFAEHFDVIAPDFIGHGGSDKPRGDYSPSAFATSVRDLLTVLNVPRANFIGHSFGGGIAMQVAYQFPDYVERMVLVGTGGLGREVSPFLRMATLPGSARALAAIQLPLLRQSVSQTTRAVARIVELGPMRTSILDLLEIYESLQTAAARRAFQSTLRSTVSSGGQTMTMLDRAYLASAIPTLLIWGARDVVLPVHHAHAGHDAMPGSRLEIFPKAGHTPHRQDPERFVRVVEEFIDDTDPAEYDVTAWRQQLRTTAMRSDKPPRRKRPPNDT